MNQETWRYHQFAIKTWTRFGECPMKPPSRSTEW
jgi:Ni/Co efflux regulator RcnB